MALAEDIEQLNQGLRGQVVRPSDPDYEDARRVYNGMIDRRPRLVARCADAADVIAAVNFARENELDLAIRGGGHNVAGFGTVDDGIVIDMAGMRGVRVNPAKRTVRVEGGCKWGDVDHAAHAFGLAVPAGIISTTGVAGLTLGGGTGYLTRKYGLTLDNLISVDVVTADGRLVTASVEENEDLFWAIRGGGGNFGVVTSFEFRAHPVSEIYGGPIFYPIEKTTDVLRFFREYIAGAPPEMGAFFAFQKGPPVPFMPENLVNVTMCAIVACYAGQDLTKGEEVVKPLLDLGPPAALHVDRMPLPALNSAFDPLLPPGLQHYWKADFFDDLSDEAIEAHARHGPDVPALQSTMHIYTIDGAPQRVGQEETAFAYRDAAFNVVIAGMWPEPADSEKNTKWVRDYFDALHPHSSGGAYVNFMTADEGQERIAASYRGNYERLVSLKAKYDPSNLFHVNQNIRPA
jgi:UDP-N-acetylenolpyruvoylglucosamine reductase